VTLAREPSTYIDADIEFVARRVLELSYVSWSLKPFAVELGYDGPPFAWDEERRAMLRGELDAWYARAYGLTRDELRYILDPAPPASCSPPGMRRRCGPQPPNDCAGGPAGFRRAHRGAEGGLG
jgi:hypothetical protein